MRTHVLFPIYTIPLWCLSPDPEDYSSAVRYNVTFRQTAYSDEGDPAPTALSEPILIDIVTDYDLEDVEYFQARIVETSDEIRVRIGQDIVNVTIIDRESFTFVLKTYISYILFWYKHNALVWLARPSLGNALF